MKRFDIVFRTYIYLELIWVFFLQICSLWFPSILLETELCFPEFLGSLVHKKPLGTNITIKNRTHPSPCSTDMQTVNL